MTLLLQVSDPHFGTERPGVTAALERLCHDHHPDLLLLTGDITQRATDRQFMEARRFVDRLHVKARLIIPGNHDIPLFDVLTRLRAPYARYERAFGRVAEIAEHATDDVLVLALNTTRRYRHKHGEVSARQIERVAERFARAAPGQRRLVAVHQPVAVTRAQDEINLLRGHERAVRRWAEAGADLVIGGHIHLPFVIPLRERWPDLPRPMWAVQAGTAVSTRIRSEVGNSVNLIRATADGCHVERWDHDESTGLFAAVRDWRLACGSAAARPAAELDAGDAHQQPGRP